MPVITRLREEPRPAEVHPLRAVKHDLSTASLRASGSQEWRDDVNTATRRLLVELRLRLPGE